MHFGVNFACRAHSRHTHHISEDGADKTFDRVLGMSSLVFVTELEQQGRLLGEIEGLADLMT